METGKHKGGREGTHHRVELGIHTVYFCAHLREQRHRTDTRQVFSRATAVFVGLEDLTTRTR